MLCDTRKKVSFRAKFQYHIGAIPGIHNLNQRDHIGMITSLMMKLYFPLLELTLSLIQSNFIQCLDRITRVGNYVECGVNNTISANPKDRFQLQSISKNQAKSIFWSTKSIEPWWWRGCWKHHNMKRISITKGKAPFTVRISSVKSAVILWG